MINDKTHEYNIKMVNYCIKYLQYWVKHWLELPSDIVSHTIFRREVTNVTYHTLNDLCTLLQEQKELEERIEE